MNNKQIDSRAKEIIDAAKANEDRLEQEYFDRWPDITQAAANKTVEESELPTLPEKTVIDKHIPTGIVFRGHTDKAMQEYARQAIAADRAARPVANKAEVDLSELPIAWYMKEVHPGWPEFNRIDEFSGGLTDGEKLVRLDDVEALLPTPTATTGASTARDQALEEAARICDGVNNHDNPMTAGDCADSIRALKGSVGASTVDEPRERSLKEIMADAGRRRTATNAAFDMLKGDGK